MERLWAPWRMEYVTQDKDGDCFLCRVPKENDDEKNLLLLRGQSNFVVMNLFPYGSGHLLVAPYCHTANLDDLRDDEATEHFELVKKSISILRKALNPEGFNVGLNLGKVAGAGVAGHLHTHIVPRWQGDANFMPVLCDTRVMPEALINTYWKLKGSIPPEDTTPII